MKSGFSSIFLGSAIGFAVGGMLTGALLNNTALASDYFVLAMFCLIFVSLLETISLRKEVEILKDSFDTYVNAPIIVTIAVAGDSAEEEITDNE